MAGKIIFELSSKTEELRSEFTWTNRGYKIIIAFVYAVIGLKPGHALANFALTEQWFMLTTAHFASQSKFLRKLVCIRTTFHVKSLSLRILSEKRQFLCFSQVPAGSDYPDFRPIMHIRYSFILYPFFLLVKKVEQEEPALLF